jgi:hypothetical protein
MADNSLAESIRVPSIYAHEVQELRSEALAIDVESLAMDSGMHR